MTSGLQVRVFERFEGCLSVLLRDVKRAATSGYPGHPPRRFGKERN